MFPVSKPHTHITYMLRQCTSIVYICLSILLTMSVPDEGYPRNASTFLLTYFAILV